MLGCGVVWFLFTKLIGGYWQRIHRVAPLDAQTAATLFLGDFYRSKNAWLWSGLVSICQANWWLLATDSSDRPAGCANCGDVISWGLLH